ncbi:unnamed protein product [Ectocarpus sp. 12 AP-2014]
MRPCSKPRCHRTRPKKGITGRTIAGRCVRPNPWNMYMIRMNGSGYGMQLLAYDYKKWKRRWALENPGLGPSEARERMNETLCEEQAEEEGREAGRGNREAVTFFARRRVPSDWSLRDHLRQLDHPFVFRHTLRSGKKVKEMMTTRVTGRMKPQRWFTDDLINAYMALLGGSGNPASTECLFMNSHFYTKFKGVASDTRPAELRHPLVKKWTSSLDTTRAHKIFVPVNHANTHWTMVVIDVEKRKVSSLDSQNGDQKQSTKHMLDWIEQEHISKKVKFDRREWKQGKKTVPSQMNSNDCGPFACLFAAFVSNEEKMTFSQEDMPEMRARLVWSILNATL